MLLRGKHEGLSSVAEGGGSKAHLVIAQVKLGVIGANENIAKNPQRPHGRGHIKANEAAQADGFTKLRHLKTQWVGCAFNQGANYGLQLEV